MNRTFMQQVASAVTDSRCETLKDMVVAQNDKVALKDGYVVMFPLIPLERIFLGFIQTVRKGRSK